jgi:uncharacterized protein YutE (UPF0331/DUF86 family)
MMPGRVSKRVIADRLGWVESMLARIRALPLRDKESFFDDARSEAAAESYLRRVLEALLDLGRHILAKGFGKGVTEYKQIARQLRASDVLTEHEAALLEDMAGYRNRMVHFYHEVTSEELYEICATRLEDVEQVVAGLKRWVREHPQRIDERL